MLGRADLLGVLVNHSESNISGTAAITLPSFGEEVIKVSLGYYQTCILLKSGSLYCWGDNRIWGVGAWAYSEHIGDNEFVYKIE